MTHLDGPRNTLRYIELKNVRPAVNALVHESPLPPDSPAMWPAIGEYPIYNSDLYRSLTSDETRNNRFRAALQKLSQGKVVLDIGTGEEAFWAREAIAAGARHVVAMEVMEDAFAAAAENVGRSGTGEAITLLHGASTDLSVGRPADVCVAEVIGSVAGAEGAAAILSDARRRLLKPGAVIIPHHCDTQSAAVSLRKVLGGREPAFAVEAVPLLERIIGWNRAPFDVRLRIRNPDRDAVISTQEAVEVLDFNGELRCEQEQSVTFKVTRSGHMDGILTWLQIACLPDEVPLDALRDNTSWASVYFPLFDHEIPVEPGDQLHVTFRTELSDDHTHPDYHIKATLRAGGSDLHAQHTSLHHGKLLHSHPLYRRLLTTHEER
ncbi:class I SAM-dependent methyltransferase [Streptomyces sp. NPDC021093]|uniref:class I SAM-dependent methyltransferase n=1 Tax=Streptomyces sp. NPDC021093 TaxID=3365112 RepID=UPI003794C472